MTFEGLCVAAIILTAGGVANVSDRSGTGVLLHHHLGRFGVAEMKHLGDGADVTMGVDQLFPVWAEGGHSGGQLAAVLNVQQQSGHQPRCFLRSLRGRQAARLAVRQVVNRGNATLVEQLGHGIQRPCASRISKRLSVHHNERSRPYQRGRRTFAVRRYGLEEMERFQSPGSN